MKIKNNKFYTKCLVIVFAWMMTTNVYAKDNNIDIAYLSMGLMLGEDSGGSMGIEIFPFHDRDEAYGFGYLASATSDSSYDYSSTEYSFIYNTQINDNSNFLLSAITGTIEISDPSGYLTSGSDIYSTTMIGLEAKMRFAKRGSRHMYSGDIRADIFMMLVSNVDVYFKATKYTDAQSRSVSKTYFGLGVVF